MAKKRAADPIKSVEDVHYIQGLLKWGGKTHSKRNYLLFILGITTGYRAGDLVKLRVVDIKTALRYGYFEILESKKEKSGHTKNLRPRRVAIVSNLKKELKEYIKDKKDYEYIFYSQKGRHLSTKAVTDILKDVGQSAKLYHLNLSAHSMRKTFAYTVWLNNGKDLLLVKELLGHSTIEYTKLYLGLDIELYGSSLKPLNNLII